MLCRAPCGLEDGCVCWGVREASFLTSSLAKEPPKASSDPVLLPCPSASPKEPRAWVISGVGRHRPRREARLVTTKVRTQTLERTYSEHHGGRTFTSVVCNMSTPDTCILCMPLKGCGTAVAHPLALFLVSLSLPSALLCSTPPESSLLN